MLRTHSALKKRLIKTANGMKRAKSSRHIMRNKSNSNKMKARKQIHLLPCHRKLFKKHLQSIF